jgi:hypothetical protein
VDQVPWDLFISQTFASLPVLQSLPDPSDLEKVLGRVVGDFGPLPPEVVTREVLACLLLSLFFLFFFLFFFLSVAICIGLRVEMVVVLVGTRGCGCHEDRGTIIG